MDDLQRILAIEEIKQLKYRYLRFLDTKAWDELAEYYRRVLGGNLAD